MKIQQQLGLCSLVSFLMLSGNAAAQTVGVRTAPQVAGLQLSQQLSSLSLASHSALAQLLAALPSLVDEHPDVRKARAAWESAGHDVNTARSARYPRFKVGTTSGSADRAGGKENYNALNAEARMTLLDGGNISAGIDSAQSQYAAQAEVLRGTQQNVVLEGLTAMLELQRYRSKSQIAAESAGIITQLANIEERRAQLGAVGRNDLRQAASRQAGALAQQHALEAQFSDAQARFVRYFNFTPPASGLPELQVPAQWFAASESLATEAALQSSVELQEIQQQIERSKAEVERQKSKRLPALDVVVARVYDPKGVLYNDGTRYGVELNWDVGNGFELRDNIRKALNELQSQEAQQEAVLRQVRETVAGTWARVQSGRARAQQLQSAVTEARGAFEGRRRLLEVGRGSLAQVLDAQLDMQTLMLEAADAHYDLRINELQLARVGGRLLPEQEGVTWLHALFPLQSPAQAGPQRAAQQAASTGLAQAPAYRLHLERHVSLPAAGLARHW